MRLRQFRLMVVGPLTDEHVDRLFDRADDACVEMFPGGGTAWVAFDREAPTLIDAIVSGVRDLDTARINTVAAAVDDPIVTLEVIAERVGRPVEVVRSWHLPMPVGPHPRRPTYDWGEVADQLVRQGTYASPDEAVTMRAVTLALQLRALAPQLERMAPIRALLYT